MELLMFLVGYIKFAACFILVTSFLGVRWWGEVRAVKVQTFKVSLIDEETDMKYVSSDVSKRRQVFVQKFWR